MSVPRSKTGRMLKACSLEELAPTRVRVVSMGGRTIAIFLDEGRVYALDNRCPHMGFPLHLGTVLNGVLTCHWHHARFDLAGGSTFDPFADDVPAFRAEIMDGQVWVDPEPIEEARAAHWNRKLEEGLQQQIPLVIAKSVIGLDVLGETSDILRRATLFGIRNRAAGWSTGMSVMAAVANVLPYLAPEDRPLALYHGLSQVAASTGGQAPTFTLAPLRTAESRPERFLEWFRHSVEIRAAPGAERILRTAIRVGLSEKSVAEMVFGAATDHRYLDGGHTLYFANKAFELLQHIGWGHAEEVLPSLVPHLVQAQRMEETSAWREPIDVGALLDDAGRELDGAIATGRGQVGDWKGERDLAEELLNWHPAESIARLLALVAEGVPLTKLSTTVAYAAALRMAHFHTSNEFFDWETVHHAFTYANAVDRALRRSPSPLLARGILDGAMAIYLERFLNVPKQPLPLAGSLPPSSDELLGAFDRQGGVNETAHLLATVLGGSGQKQAISVLGHAMLREDAGFHEFQNYEAAVQQASGLGFGPLAGHVLVGSTRYLAAHSPTPRASGQTYEIAARLHRGEALYTGGSPG